MISNKIASCSQGILVKRFFPLNLLSKPDFSVLLCIYWLIDFPHIPIYSKFSYNKFPYSLLSFSLVLKNKAQRFEKGLSDRTEMSFKNLIIIALVFSACDARKYGNCEVAKRLDEMKVSRSEIPICEFKL